MTRVYIQLQKIFSDPLTQEKVEEFMNMVDSSSASDLNQDNIFGLVYETFTSLDATVQELAINDLRQISATYTAGIDRGEVEPSAYPIQIANGVADFLETGEPSDILKMLLFGTEVNTPEPPIEPAPRPEPAD